MDEQISQLNEKISQAFVERIFWVCFAAITAFVVNYIGG
jgi:hypothetical protein